MQYLGGKSRLAKHIAPIIESYRTSPEQLYVEPFVGGGSILCAVSGNRYACDMNWSLVTLWRELRDGWEPPMEVNAEDWAWANALRDPRDPFTAMAGFGCSFGAQWFASYAEGKGGTAYRVLKKQQALIQGVQFRCCSYADLEPQGMVVYCDPPYANTAGYNAIGAFDSEKFWETMYRWAQTNTVLVSEFSAPDDPRIKEIWSVERKVTLASHGKYKTAVDILYEVSP